MALRGQLNKFKKQQEALFESKHDVKDQNQLLKLIRSYPNGIPVLDLKDAYPTVMEDLQALKAAGQVWLLSNYDSEEDMEDVAYPNDPEVPAIADDDLKQLFRSIKLPQDMIDIKKDIQRIELPRDMIDIEKDLQKTSLQ